MNAVDKSKWTALHYAAWKRHPDVAKVLIQNGAGVNAVDARQKWQHFTWQLRNGHIDVVKVLIQNGADVNAVDKQCQTFALHWATQRTR